MSSFHLDNYYVGELSLCKFADIFKGNISPELFLYKLIIDKGVQDTFLNVAIALRMYCYQL